MLLSFALMYGNIKLLQNKRNKTSLELYLVAIVVWNLYLYMGTEVLSFFNAISYWSLVIYWGVINILLLILLAIGIVKIKPKFESIVNFNKIKRFWIPILIIGIALVLAILTVPNNWDSMTYHLPRIVHWVQNGTVSHYVTNSIRQVTNPPMAEFVNLHLYVLMRKSDLLFNVLQCSSYITNAVIIYTIAKKIKCNQTFAYLSIILFLAMPTAFAEALTTQVDQFATLWLLIFVYFLIDFIAIDKNLVMNGSTIWKIILMSSCVGFGYLTKPTVSVAMLILLIWLLIICIIRKDNIVVMFRLLVSAVPMVVLIIFPEIIRNVITFGAIAAPVAGQRQLVSTINPLYLLVNFLKNISINLPNIFIYNSDDLIFKSVRKISKILHVDMNHPSISESDFFLRTPPSYGHDSAINVTIVVLITVCIVIGTIKLYKNKKLKKSYLNISFIMIFSFLFICLFFRWNPYISRYMLPYLAMCCPAVAIILQWFCEEVKNKNIKVVFLIYRIFYVRSRINRLCYLSYRFLFRRRDASQTQRIFPAKQRI